MKILQFACCVKFTGKNNAIGLINLLYVTILQIGRNRDGIKRLAHHGNILEIIAVFGFYKDNRTEIAFAFLGLNLLGGFINLLTRNKHKGLYLTITFALDIRLFKHRLTTGHETVGYIQNDAVGTNRRRHDTTQEAVIAEVNRLFKIDYYIVTTVSSNADNLLTEVYEGFLKRSQILILIHSCLYINGSTFLLFWVKSCGHPFSMKGHPRDLDRINPSWEVPMGTPLSGGSQARQLRDKRQAAGHRWPRYTVRQRGSLRLPWD